MKSVIQWISLVVGIVAGVIILHDGHAAVSKKRIVHQRSQRKSMVRKKARPARAARVQKAAVVAPQPVIEPQMEAPIVTSTDSIQPSMISDVRAQKTGTPDLDRDFERLNALEPRYAEGSIQQARLRRSTTRIVRKLEARNRAASQE